MNKGLMIALSLACLAFITAAAACCRPPATPAIRGSPAENGAITILVENTSVTLPVQPLELK